MSEWLIGFETVVVGVVVIVFMAIRTDHREKMARMMIESWEKTLDQKPLGMFMRSGVHPIPDLLGNGALPSPRWAKFKRVRKGLVMDDDTAMPDASDTADAEEDLARESEVTEPRPGVH